MCAKMEIEQICLQFLKLYKMKKGLDKRKRRWNVNPINRDKIVSGYFPKVFKTIKSTDVEHFFIHTRMRRETFGALLTLIRFKLMKPKQRIFAEERLSITLLFLAHGNSLQTLAWKYKIGKSTARKIVLETCDILWSVLSPLYLAPPTEDQYMHIEADFAKMWNFPNCVGAIDGKHIAVKCPRNSHSQYFNYKKFFSMVLMATCDAKYTFTAVSFGAYGSESDGGVFQLSDFGRSLLNGTLPLPPEMPLPNTNVSFPSVFVADAAFPLKRNLMRPYPGQMLQHQKKVFNYRLSRARRTIENAFGILTARWRILLTTLEFEPENCEKIVLACVLLHNFIMFHDAPPQDEVTARELEGNNGLLSIRSSYDRRSSQRAMSQRDILANYFVNEGSVSFQPQP